MFLTRRCRYTLIGALIVQTSISMHAVEMLHGDSSAEDQTFIHPIKRYEMGPEGQLYVASHDVGAKEFALAMAGPYSHDFLPLAFEKVTLDNTETATNPLFDAQINHMVLMHSTNPNSLTNEKLEHIAAVTQTEPSTIYLVDSKVGDRIEMFCARDLKDAAGTSTSGSIIQMTAGNDFYIYAAVTDQSNQPFGQGNSGIALVTRRPIKKEENQPIATLFAQVDAYQTGTVSGIIRAIQLNNQSPVLHIGNSTVTIQDNAVDLDWFGVVDSLYIGLTIKAQGTEADGGQAIAVGRWNHVKITTKDKKEYVHSDFRLKGIAFPSAFIPGVNNIVGSIGTDVTVAVHQTRPLMTSTSLDYIVILGGVGTSDATRRTVYALPVVRRSDVVSGMLAKKTDVPTNQGLGFCFVEPATKQGDLFTADDQEVRVGNGSITEGDIASIMAYGDAVYAVVRNADPGHKSGIFHSQALFDGLGRIKGWTTWRCVSSVDEIFGAVVSQHTGNIAMLTGPHVDNIHTVVRTTWSNDSNNLVQWLNDAFPAARGGIQGLFDIPVITPGIAHISLVIATGRNQIALAQTGIEQGNALIPISGSELADNPVSFSQGVIKQSMTGATNAMAIRGGVLDELQIIKAATITRIGSAGYLFVGGTKGLAVLVNKQGFSWDARIGLGDKLTGLAEGSTFVKIGSYTFIRKLICDDEHGLLYVVTDSTVDRINIGASNFNTGKISTTTLANLKNLPVGSHDTILDAVISRSFALIATNIGLFRSGLHTDIRTALSAGAAAWQKVSLPEGFDAVKQIFTITQTGREQDLTTGACGMIYILDTNQGKHQAMVHRFTINEQNTDEYTLEELPDLFIKDKASYFVQFSGYRTWIYTDGALFFQERDKTRDEGPLLALVPEQVRSGVRFGGNRQITIPIDIQDTSVIQPIVRSSASGSWFLARNNTLSVNE